MSENRPHTLFGYPVVYTDSAPPKSRETPVVSHWVEWEGNPECLLAVRKKLIEIVARERAIPPEDVTSEMLRARFLDREDSP